LECRRRGHTRRGGVESASGNGTTSCATATRAAHAPSNGTIRTTGDRCSELQDRSDCNRRVIWRYCDCHGAQGSNAKSSGVAGRTACAIGDDYREQRMIVGSRRGRCRISRRSRATNCTSVLSPLVTQRGRARHGHSESRRLSYRNIRAGRLGCNGRGHGRAIPFWSDCARHTCASRMEQASQ
jgi:hypothetical protein